MSRRRSAPQCRNCGATTRERGLCPTCALRLNRTCAHPGCDQPAYGANKYCRHHKAERDKAYYDQHRAQHHADLVSKPPPVKATKPKPPPKPFFPPPPPAAFRWRASTPEAELLIASYRRMIANRPADAHPVAPHTVSFDTIPLRGAKIA